MHRLTKYEQGLPVLLAFLASAGGPIGLSTDHPHIAVNEIVRSGHYPVRCLIASGGDHPDHTSCRAGTALMMMVESVEAATLMEPPMALDLIC